ncbi:MAG: phosphoribosyltransferase [Euryarchaeota archaeon]|nr:phosphoribosyltransferase [Euryarchaeota archaeon]MDE1837019.1 phosphoribosyltransferase [Euryarchaeota archaeon]MDE1879869.1 phosphoribosyltransferase [Euryarchaeota archaeon]MDE2045677.1 phosphoribosyltransferase [Thermoplasmata archaeon]
MELPPCRLVTWADIDRWSEVLTQKIREAKWTPEVIVGLTRGGWVPSRMLADRLGTKHLAALRAQHWGVTATPSGKAEITEGLSGRLDGKRVLVVDDITDTGQSLQLAVRHVAERGPSQVESATYLHIAHSTYVPTYFAEEVPRDAWRWFVFPWNYWEDLRALARQAAGTNGSSASTARQVLHDRCQLDVPLKHVRQALEPV